MPSAPCPCTVPAEGFPAGLGHPLEAASAPEPLLAHTAPPPPIPPPLLSPLSSRRRAGHCPHGCSPGPSHGSHASSTAPGSSSGRSSAPGAAEKEGTGRGAAALSAPHGPAGPAPPPLTERCPRGAAAAGAGPGPRCPQEWGGAAPAKPRPSAPSRNATGRRPQGSARGWMVRCQSRARRLRRPVCR